jgi:hypothetical protein
MLLRLFSLGLLCTLLSAAQDLAWISEFTAPATPENTQSEAGRQNALNWDPRFVKLVQDAFPQPQYFWHDHGQFTEVPDLVHEFTGVPGYPLLSDDRYAWITGCVPHDCADRGFLWIDTRSAEKPLLIFAATGAVNSNQKDGGRSLIHLRLFTSRKLNWDQLPPNFKTSVAQWWNQTTQIWTKYSPEHIVLVTLIQPSGEEVDLSSRIFALAAPPET